LKPFHLAKLGVDDLARLPEIAARGVDEAQTPERKRHRIGQPPASHIDQLEAAAAEVAGKAVGGMEAGDDAERRKLGLLGAGQDGDLMSENALGLGDEVGPV